MQFSSENQYLLRVNSSDPKSDHYYQVREHSSTQKLGINHIGIMDFVELFDVAWIYHDTACHSQVIRKKIFEIHKHFFTLRRFFNASIIDHCIGLG